MTRPSEPGTRWVAAPPDSDPSAPNRILGVWLAMGERVRWEWSHVRGGGPYVSGYFIEQPWRRKPLEPRRIGFRAD